LFHHDDDVGHGQSLALVVGDEDGGDAGLALDLLQFDPHLVAQVRVEGGERLVEQQHVGLDDNGAGQRDALLLAAGSSEGSFFSTPGRRTISRARVTFSAIVALGTLRYLRPKAMLSKMVLCGNKRSSGTPGRCSACGSARRSSAARRSRCRAGRVHETGDRAQDRGLAAAGRPSSVRNVPFPIESDTFSTATKLP